MDTTEQLRRFALSIGADLFGVADLSNYRDQYGVSQGLLSRFPYAISIAVRLPDAVVDAITPEDPTSIYAHTYRVVNSMLDQMALRIANECQRLGGKALPIPASQTVDLKRNLGAISHKAVAVLAGLGWMGKSLLVINPEFGPRMRLATILTDLKLKPNKPMKNRCGDCTKCIEACPVKAIKAVNFEVFPPTREQVLDVEACAWRLYNIEADPRYGSPVCGVCVKVCPVGSASRI